MSHYCSNCGSLLVEKIIENRLRGVCESCGQIHYGQRKLSASVRIVNDGKILLVQRGIDPWYGEWHMPSGYVEVDEEPETAAQRETLEETGLIVKIGKLVSHYTYDDDPRGNGLILLFDAYPIGGELTTSKETLDLGYFSPDEARKLSLAGMSARNSVNDWLTGMNG